VPGCRELAARREIGGEPGFLDEGSFGRGAQDLQAALVLAERPVGSADGQHVLERERAESGPSAGEIGLGCC